MMIAVSAAIAAIFWSGILIGITYWMRKKNFFIKRSGIGSIISVYLFCMLRMLLPLNFDFTVGIRVKGFFSYILYAICIKQYQIGAYFVTIFDGLLIVWAAVTLALLLRFAWQYLYTCICLRKADKTEKDAYCMELLQIIAEQKGKRCRITVLRSDQVHIPIGIGIFKRRIVLPKMDYTEQELYYILLHEYTHFLNGDLLIKMMVYIVCCIMWWNPLVNVLRKDLEQSLEIKCDLCITEELSIGETANYLAAIVRALKSAKDKDDSDIKNKAALCKKKKSVMRERFDYVVRNLKNKGESKKAVAAWIALVGVIWMASCTAFLIPAYEPPAGDIVTRADVVGLTPETAYVIYENGKYEVFINDKSYGECNELCASMLDDSGFDVRRKEK